MKGFLVLETGEVFSGLWSGKVPRVGEVVFNTSHSGYEEIATDPSYFSQIVVMTAPMQGNYGESNEVWESQQIWIEGFVCLQIQKSKREASWLNKLIQNNVPVLSEVDTRQLVLRLREGGTTWGALLPAQELKSEKEAIIVAQKLIQDRRTREKDWVYLASRKTVETRKGYKTNGPRIAVLDFGVKENILRETLKYSSEIKIFPSRTNVKEILSYNPEGVLLTNGPGDPADVISAVETVRDILGKKPIFGICMGHQILGLALGAKTYKLKFGHRGANHPIRDDLLNRIYVSSQNHGYAVDIKTLPADVKVTQVNLNDNTVAGIYSKERKCLGIQYHPESCPGPHDANDLFRYFLEEMI